MRLAGQENWKPARTNREISTAMWEYTFSLPKNSH